MAIVDDQLALMGSVQFASLYIVDVAGLHVERLNCRDAGGLGFFKLYTIYVESLCISCAVSDKVICTSLSLRSSSRTNSAVSHL